MFLTKKSTQAENYLNSSNFCDDIIYLDEPKKGLNNLLNNISSIIKNVHKINNYNFDKCFVFHPSLRYLIIAKFSKIKEIWGLGLKFQNFLLNKNRKLYNNFFSKTVENDNEALEFVKKITNLNDIKFKPLYSLEYKLRDTVGIIIAASGHEKRWSILNYIEVINFLIQKDYKKFLIISGVDQFNEEDSIKNYFGSKIEIFYTSNKKIKDVVPILKKCKFCIGNDTGFSHLSVNLDIPTLIIHGDCPPQFYSNLIKHIDKDPSIARSASSIHTITANKVINELSFFISGRDGRVV